MTFCHLPCPVFFITCIYCYWKFLSCCLERSPQSRKGENPPSENKEIQKTGQTVTIEHIRQNVLLFFLLCYSANLLHLFSSGGDWTSEGVCVQLFLFPVWAQKWQNTLQSLKTFFQHIHTNKWSCLCSYLFLLSFSFPPYLFQISIQMELIVCWHLFLKVCVPVNNCMCLSALCVFIPGYTFASLTLFIQFIHVCVWMFVLSGLKYPW